MNSKTPENIILSVAALVIMDDDVLKIGENLIQEGADKLTDGGFWVWDITSDVEFYSPKFRATLGFEGENDFPSVAASWMQQINKDDLKVAIENFEKAKKTKEQFPYYQIVRYTKKNGEQLTVLCSGILVKGKILIGTHKIIKNARKYT